MLIKDINYILRYSSLKYIYSWFMYKIKNAASALLSTYCVENINRYFYFSIIAGCCREVFIVRGAGTQFHFVVGSVQVLIISGETKVLSQGVKLTCKGPIGHRLGMQ